MKALSRGRVARLAAEHGWEVWSSHPGGASITGAVIRRSACASAPAGS
jgi:hypothetical protein